MSRVLRIPQTETNEVPVAEHDVSAVTIANLQASVKRLQEDLMRACRGTADLLDERWVILDEVRALRAKVEMLEDQKGTLARALDAVTPTKRGEP